MAGSSGGGPEPWYRRRKHLSVYVTPQAYEAFTDYAKRHEVTVAALVEQLGRMLGQGIPSSAAVERRLVQGAREIDQQRRRRSPSR